MGHREDLNYLIGEIQGELSNSHTYVGGGDRTTACTPVATGLVGADYALDAKSGRYYISKVYVGDNTHDGYASPLTEPGLDVQTGDYVLAVDGRDLKAPTDIYSLFVGTRGQHRDAHGGGRRGRHQPP